MYRRQLSVPLLGNDEAMGDAKEAFAGDAAGLKEACHAHAKAKKMVRDWTQTRPDLTRRTPTPHSDFFFCYVVLRSMAACVASIPCPEGCVGFQGAQKTVATRVCV